MEDENSQFVAEERLKNLPVQAENPAFAAAEMLTCGRCARSSPPTRADCFYCGAALEISASQSKFLKPNLRAPEAWEKGCNLIFAPDSANVGDAQTARAASLLKFDAEILRGIIAARKPLPLARIASETDAEILRANLLEAAGIETKIVADEDLKADVAPRRLRAMEFYESKVVFVFFNADEIAPVSWTDLALIVTGALVERRISGVEGRGKSGESKLLESNETASDTVLFDIYSRADALGFRVEQQGFDFSCLGAEKTLLAAENLRALVKALSSRAPAAKVVEDYRTVRAHLGAVWSVEERTDALGLKRDRFAKFNRENLTSISNAAQFTKYSRLQKTLLIDEK